jgi:RNA polymerase sigma factor (sigma-70 family)
MSGEERDALVLGNRRLAWKIALRLWHRVPLVRNVGSDEDARQIALLGLVKAADTFDAGRGVKFSTYATHTIRNTIFYFASRSALVRLPQHDSRFYSRHEAPRVQALARDGLADPVTLTLEDYDQPAEGLAEMRREVGRLRPSDRELLKERFEEGLTLQQLGERHGRTKARMKQVLDRILGTLRGKLEGANAGA